MKTINPEERKDFRAILMIAGALIAAYALAFIRIFTL
jgi:hypothetical protein